MRPFLFAMESKADALMEYRVPVDTVSALDCDLDEDGGGCNDDDETNPTEKGNVGSSRHGISRTDRFVAAPAWIFKLI